ncbi:hypothetical protein C8Q75DRAFT_115487 [Abortiporus biennis]|nr:hypothetical protein C8Q75DRAFT_115487 [Abortiporus biennis]
MAEFPSINSDELPKAPKTIMDMWVTRLQAVAVVTALLAQVEVSLISNLPDPSEETALNIALVIFAYAGFICNMAATVSSVVLLLAATQVPTTARRLYIKCEHQIPRTIFHYETHLRHKRRDSEATLTDHVPSSSPAPPTSLPMSPTSASTSRSYSARPGPLGYYRETLNPTNSNMRNIDPSTHRNKDDTTSVIDRVEQFNNELAKGDTEGKLLRAFGVAKGWHFMIMHCVFCFFLGTISTFIHVAISLWSQQSRVVAGVSMGVMVLAAGPAIMFFVLSMDGNEDCEECNPRKSRTRAPDEEFDLQNHEKESRMLQSVVSNHR